MNDKMLKRMILEEIKKALQEVQDPDLDISEMVRRGVSICKATDVVLDVKRAGSGYERSVINMMRAFYVDNDHNEAVRQFKGLLQSTSRDPKARKAFLDMVQIYGKGIESAKSGSCLEMNWIKEKGYAGIITPVRA